jgi:hypothetical protein
MPEEQERFGNTTPKKLGGNWEVGKYKL